MAIPAPSVSEIKARLAALCILIDASAPVSYDDPPNSINPSAGYCWVILPGEKHDDKDYFGPGTYLQTRHWHCYLFTGTLGTGTPGQAAAACTPLLDGFTEFFEARPMLEDPDTDLDPILNIYKLIVGDDSGVTGIDWAGLQYIGVNFQLEVQGVGSYDYTEGE